MTTATEAVSDVELVKAYCSGDGSAFDQIHKRYSGLVYSVSYRVLKDASAAEDASVACFMLFAKKASELASAVNLGSWFYWCASHVAKNERKMRVRRMTHEKEAYEMNAQPDMPNGNIQEILPAVEEQIAGLPNSQRQVLVMMYYQGMTKAEIASQLQCPEGTVASWLGRALERIRSGLRRNGKDLTVEELATGFTGAALLMPVPAGLAAKLATLAGGGAVGAGVSELVRQAMTSMLIAKVKTAVVVASAVVVVGGGAATTYSIFKPDKLTPVSGAVLYDDDFKSKRLSEFWTMIEPAEGVQFGAGRLRLEAAGGKNDSAVTRVVSRKVELGGKPVEIFFDRDRKCSLPMGTRIEVIVRDQSDRTVAMINLAPFIRTTGTLDATWKGILGEEPEQNYRTNGGGLPGTMRFFLDPSGRMAIGMKRAAMENGDVFGIGRTGQAVSAISLELRVSAEPGKKCLQSYNHITISSLESLPSKLRARMGF